MSIQELLKAARPTLSESSLKTYSSILKNIFKRDEANKDKEFNKEYFYNSSKVIKLLPPEPNKRKSYLSAIIVLCNDKEKCKEYTEQMNEDADKVAAFNKTQQKNEKQEKVGFLEKGELMSKYNDLVKYNKTLWKTAKDIYDYQSLQNQVILALYCLTEPRRLLDYTEMKIKEINREQDNYIYSKKFYFNKYKTAKFKGSTSVAIPDELNKILKKWISLIQSKTEYLLSDTNFNKLTPTALNKRLQAILGKGRSVNILRHSYLSNKYSPAVLKELEKDTQNMGTSIHEAINSYVKL